MALGGFLAWSVFQDGPNSAGYFGAFNIFFIAVGSALGTNFGSRDCWIGIHDAFPDRLLFFRGLPISPGEVVAGRALARVPPLLLNTVGLFLPSYLISLLAGGGVADLFEPGSYFWFALIWLGYALPWLGFQFFAELGMHGQTYNIVMFASLPVLAFIAFLPFIIRVPILAELIRLANTHGVLAAVIALAAGAALSIPIFALTVRRVARRDLVT